jgi:hypothetical protein
MRQEDLLLIFRRLKGILQEYGGRGGLASKFDLEGKYDLWSFKDLEIAGRKRKEVFFASIIIQSSYVGFYYMPIYTDTSLKDVFEPELLSLLKGKSCFHIRSLDDKLIGQIEKALEIG